MRTRSVLRAFGMRGKSKIPLEKNPDFLLDANTLITSLWLRLCCYRILDIVNCESARSLLLYCIYYLVFYYLQHFSLVQLLTKENRLTELKAMVIAIGFEGSANKLGIGIIRDGEVNLVNSVNYVNKKKQNT